MSESGVSPDDPMRQCPTCRLLISILATRCHHCGESVGRPKKEEAKLTIEDLGGESTTNYRVSGNVMDALEAFRAEEMSTREAERLQKEAKSQTLFRRRAGKIEQKAGGQDSGLPELDEAHRNLAEIGEAYSPRSRGGAGASQYSGGNVLLIQRLLFGGGVLLGLILLYVGASYAWAEIQAYRQRNTASDEVVYVSRGLEMLEAGQPVDLALEEAVKAVGITDSPENQKTLTEVRQRVVEHVEGLLNADPWKREMLDQASTIITHSVKIDNSRELLELERQVREEAQAYQIILVGLDTDTLEATFKIYDPSYPKEEQTVQLDDLIQGRFLVERISSTYVRLKDLKRVSARGERALFARLRSRITGAS